MNKIEIQIPTNRKFGFFFSAIFGGVSIYLYVSNQPFISVIIGSICIVFLLVALIKVALIKDNWLFPLNKLWSFSGSNKLV